MAAVDTALEAGLPSDAETRVHDLLFEPLFDGCCRSLPGDPPATVEPFQVKLKVDADLSKVKGRPRVYLPKTAWLDEQFAQLADAAMVYESPQAICSNPSCPGGPEEEWLLLVRSLEAVNEQSEPMAAPPMFLEERTSAFAGASLFMTVDLNEVSGKYCWLRTRRNYSRL